MSQKQFIGDRHLVVHLYICVSATLMLPVVTFHENKSRPLFTIVCLLICLVMLDIVMTYSCK